MVATLGIFKFFAISDNTVLMQNAYNIILYFIRECFPDVIHVKVPLFEFYSCKIFGFPPRNWYMLLLSAPPTNLVLSTSDVEVSKNISRIKFIIIRFFFIIYGYMKHSLTLYPPYKRVGSRNLVLRHSFHQLLVVFEKLRCGSKRDAALSCYQSEKMRIFDYSEWEHNLQLLRLKSGVYRGARRASYFCIYVVVL